MLEWAYNCGVPQRGMKLQPGIYGAFGGASLQSLADRQQAPSASTTTLFCLISVGYHLEFHVAITF